MPRDFVPCLYHEWEMYDALTDVHHTRYDVVELFAMAEISTQAPMLKLTLDSHQYTLTSQLAAVEREALERDGLSAVAQALRQTLFRHLYTTYD